MGSLNQLGNKFSLSKADGDAVPTATVFNLQVASLPDHGDTFFLTPYAYRIVSAAGSQWEDASKYKVGVCGVRNITRGANISAIASAISAEINLACADDEGATAVATASDAQVTATVVGYRLECYNIKEGTSGDIVITKTTVGTGSDPLPEGYTEYITSAGNKVRVQGPAEATFLQQSGRHPKAEQNV